jgi:hypothetical protein
MLPQPNRAAGWRAPPSAAARCSHLSSSNPLQGSSLASPGLGPCGSGVPRPSGAWASPGRLEPAGSSALLDMTGCASPLDRKRSEIRHRQGPIPRLPRTIVKCPPASLQVQSLLQAQIRPSCQASGAPAARDIQGWREHAAAAARRAADGAAMGCRSGGTRRHVPFPVPLPRRVTSAVHPTQPSVARFRAQGRRARGSELNVCVCVCACVCVCGGGGGGGRPQNRPWAAPGRAHPRRGRWLPWRSGGRRAAAAAPPPPPPPPGRRSAAALLPAGPSAVGGPNTCVCPSVRRTPAPSQALPSPAAASVHSTTWAWKASSKDCACRRTSTCRGQGEAGRRGLGGGEEGVERGGGGPPRGRTHKCSSSAGHLRKGEQGSAARPRPSHGPNRMEGRQQSAAAEARRRAWLADDWPWARAASTGCRRALRINSWSGGGAGVGAFAVVL